jgi:hypothetical protein
MLNRLWVGTSWLYVMAISNLHLFRRSFSLGRWDAVLTFFVEFHVVVQTASVKNVCGELVSRDMNQGKLALRIGVAQ